MRDYFASPFYLDPQFPFINDDPPIADTPRRNSDSEETVSNTNLSGVAIGATIGIAILIGGAAYLVATTAAGHDHDHQDDSASANATVAMNTLATAMVKVGAQTLKQIGEAGLVTFAGWAGYKVASAATVRAGVGPA